MRHHLTMSRIAQKEDLSDADVIADFARQVGTPSAPDRAVPADGGRHPRHQPEGVERLEGQAARRPVPPDAARAGRRTPNLDAEIEARKQEARQILALHSALPGTEEPLWKTLEVSYFARHDARRHRLARALAVAPHRHPRADRAGAASSVGDGLQVLVYSPDRPDLFARICGYFDSAGFSIQDAKIHTTRAGYRAGHLPGREHTVERRPAGDLSRPDLAGRNTGRAGAVVGGPLPEPSRGRVSRRVRSFPVTPRVSLRPDERAQRWLLTVSASDRSGLLYAIARVLARHHINLQLAKVRTLGERVEDTFLVDGPALQQRTQLRVESELLDAVSRRDRAGTSRGGPRGVPRSVRWV